MLAVPTFNMQGERTGEVEIDPAVLGGRVRHALIKQAVVAFLDHQRQDSARRNGRSEIVGSTKKLYRQKGTGNARVGASRSPIRRGGGCTFSKRGPRSTKVLPKGMRRLARNSAILAKLEANDVMIVDGLSFSKPKTKPFAAMLKALGADSGCIVALPEGDDNIYRSGRNIPKTDIRLVSQLTAYELLRRRKLLLTRPAFDRLCGDPVRFSGSAGDGEVG